MAEGSQPPYHPAMSFQPPVPFNIAHYFLTQRIEEGRGGRTCLRTDAGNFTYAEVDALANRYANLLREAGVRPEERVMIAARSGSAAVAVFPREDSVFYPVLKPQRMKGFDDLIPVIDPEIEEPTTWVIEYFAPYAIFEAYVGSVPRGPGAVWRGNFYKCGDATSHPHWVMWNLIESELGFHKPEYFAPLLFADGLSV